MQTSVNDCDLILSIACSNLGLTRLGVDKVKPKGWFKYF